MRESIGNAYLLGIVAFFATVIMLFFVASMNYTRAFKAKNRIINILETNKTFNGNVEAEIDKSLGDMHYRIANNAKCKTDGRFKDAGLKNQTRNTTAYRYCVYEFNEANDRGTYYGVVTYMYFDIPLINVTLEFPIYGETKTMGVY